MKKKGKSKEKREIDKSQGRWAGYPVPGATSAGFQNSISNNTGANIGFQPGCGGMVGECCGKETRNKLEGYENLHREILLNPIKSEKEKKRK